MKVPLILVTVVSESLLREELLELLKRHGATGFTASRVDGEGSRGVRASDWEGQNVRLETIVALEIADSILEEISERYFEDYAVIAWQTEVNVLRGTKFGN